MKKFFFVLVISRTALIAICRLDSKRLGSEFSVLVGGETRRDGLGLVLCENSGIDSLEDIHYGRTGCSSIRCFSSVLSSFCG